MTSFVKRRRPSRLAFALRDRRSLLDDRDRGLAARLSVAYLAMAALGSDRASWTASATRRDKAFESARCVP